MKISCDENAAPRERVKTMERAYDRSRRVTKALARALDAFEKNAGTMASLAGYADSGLWLKDFEADEAGAFPDDLKRGVLSEDGLYDLLSEYAELRKRMKTLAQ